MHMLTYEQTVAASKLPNAKRVAWFASGGSVSRRTKRRWRNK
jgi:hypothetical protein